ncbi:MAG: GNAT family N-acetyltransferase [Bacillota bacterium]
MQADRHIAQQPVTPPPPAPSARVFDRLALSTPRGQVWLEGPVPPRQLALLQMNPQLNNFRPAEKQHKALVDIAGMPEGMIYIARFENEIIGYVTFHRPDEYTRWYQHPRILEMGGIEISPEWRRYKIGRHLLQLAFSSANLDEYICITMEYCWHWDLKNSGLDVWQYQRMLTGMFEKAGLSKVATDDPDILEHPANVLLAKIGPKVSKQDVLLFESLRFTKFGQMIGAI